jgi:uroporphyrinogen-III synthase
MPPLVLVTRPEPQASEWADSLRQLGLPAQALPLMSTQAAPTPDAVQRLWQALMGDEARGTDHSRPHWRALMFVSPAAVHWFFAQRPQPDASAPSPAAMHWPQHTLLIAPGLGTARALHEALQTAHLGTAQVLHPPADAEQFDSEHLWPVLKSLDWQGQQVAILSGGDAEQAKGRQWLTLRWQEAGAQVHTVLCYQRGPAHWSAAQQALARQAWAQPAQHLWLCSSSEALALLHSHQLPTLWPHAPESGARALTPAHRLLATHPRIAEAAAQIGWVDIGTCPPTLDAVARAVAARSTDRTI